MYVLNAALLFHDTFCIIIPFECCANGWPEDVAIAECIICLQTLNDSVVQKASTTTPLK